MEGSMIKSNHISIILLEMWVFGVGTSALEEYLWNQVLGDLEEAVLSDYLKDWMLALG